MSSPMIVDIQRAVAREFKVELASMTERDGSRGSRTAQRSRPRQLAMSLAWAMTRHSCSRVGQLFGDRDHTTVLCARKSVNRRLRADPEFKRATRRVLRRLREAR